MINWLTHLEWGTVVAWLALFFSLLSTLYTRSSAKRAKQAEADRKEAKWLVDIALPGDNLHAELRFRNNSEQLLEHVWISHDQFRDPNGIAITSLPDGYYVYPNQHVVLVIYDRREILQLPDCLQISWTLPQSRRHKIAHRLLHLTHSRLIADEVHYDNVMLAQTKRNILDMMANPPIENIPVDGGLRNHA